MNDTYCSTFEAALKEAKTKLVNEKSKSTRKYLREAIWALHYIIENEGKSDD